MARAACFRTEINQRLGLVGCGWRSAARQYRGVAEEAVVLTDESGITIAAVRAEGICVVEREEVRNATLIAVVDILLQMLNQRFRAERILRE